MTDATRAGVDPELLAFLDGLPAAPTDPETLPRVRETFAALPRPPSPEGAVTTRHLAPGPTGAPDVPVYVHAPDAPAASPRGLVLHFHGGGYVMGRAEASEPAGRALALALDCVVASADYRLAPEATFPAAPEDGYAALAWVFANADALGANPARIGVMGESAGGGLAAAVALMARDRGEHRLAFQHLIYPMLDDRTVSHADGGDAHVWGVANNRFAWAAMLGGAEPTAYAAPARADDLSGLPPTYLMTGALDLFADEDLAYARRLIAAGVPTELHVHPGAFHAFDLVPDAQVSQAARAQGLAALRRALAA